MLSIKNYKIKFDVWGLLLFAAIMIPNIIWAFIPAPNDILRSESQTAFIDAASRIFQIGLAASVCAVANIRAGAFKFPYKAAVLLLVLAYIAGWAAYYAGAANRLTISILCAAPCAAFILFSAARKNMVSLVFALGFTVCHVIYASVNFLA